MDGRMQDVVPLHVVIPNRSYSELDTERYICVVEGWPVCLRHRSCEGYKAQLGLRPQLGEKRSYHRGRRVNDLIEIWGGFRQLDESSKALMAEQQGFHLSVRAEPLDKLGRANARANAVTLGPSRC
jgi:hypothetical protein